MTLASQNWLIGRKVTSISITPLTQGSDGTLTPGSAATLTGALDEITINLENEGENIQAMDRRSKNYVITDSDFELRLIEILKGFDANILAGVGMGYDFASVTLTRGARAFTFVGAISAYQEGLRRGKSTGEVTIKEIDTNGYSLTYLAAS